LVLFKATVDTWIRLIEKNQTNYQFGQPTYLEQV